MRRPSGYRALIMSILAAASSLISSCGTPMPALAAIPTKAKPSESISKKGQFMRFAPPTQQMVDDEAERNRPDRIRVRSCYLRKRLMNRKLIRAITKWHS